MMEETEPSKDPFADVRSNLLDLTREPDRISPFRVWSALEPREREAAVRAALKERDPDHGLRSDLLNTLASTFNFRLETLRSWDADRVAAQYGARLKPRSPALLRNLLRTLHVAERRPLLSDFLDELDIPNDDGLVTGDGPRELPGSGAVRRAAGVLLDHHPADRVLTYFSTLIALDDVTASGLTEWLRGTVPSPSADEVPEDEEPADEEAESPGVPVDIEETKGFTTVDRVFVDVIRDTGQDVVGALSEDQLEDAVEELVALNGKRHRSFFHPGFMDSMLGREAREELPAQNRDRLQWYWAGYITGLARREEHAIIASLFDEHDAVRELGKGATGPAHVAGRLVFEALCRAGRPAQAARFLDVGTVVDNPFLFRSLRQEGRRLLHDDRASDARAIYDLLGDVMVRLKALEVDMRQRRFLEVRRRRAHCFRQLGETAKARELLEDLLVAERDPGVRAMVQADLGLIDGGFTRLADLQIPRDEERAAEFRRRLEQGEDRFRTSVDAEARYSAHGRFCLGVLEFLRDNYESAVRYLDLALSAFEAEPERYRHGGLLHNTRIYLGMAIALSLEEGRVPRAAELIEAGLEDGARIPKSYLGDVLEALHMQAPERAAAVADAVIAGAGEEALAVVAESEAGRSSRRVADALLRRGLDRGRGEEARAEDLRGALDALLTQERHSEAATALDALEELARRGAGRDEFLKILTDADRYQPVWTIEDARWSRVGCLEAAGRYEEAQSELATHFHEVVTSGRYDAQLQARGIVDRIQSYGLNDDETVSRLESRLDAMEDDRPAPEEEEDETPRKVRVLFVGGDERQHDDADRVQEELAESHPSITVGFLHPGWGSNWSHDLKQAAKKADTADAVVIMRYIRTEFGRQLRKSMGSTPWCACTTSGLRTMKRSILDAAQLGRRQLERQEEEIRSNGT